MSPNVSQTSEGQTLWKDGDVIIISGTNISFTIKIDEVNACSNYAKLLKSVNPTYWFDGKEFNTLKEMNDYKSAYNSKNAIKFMKHKNFRK